MSFMKEAEMRAIKLAGVVGLLAVSGAMAQSSSTVGLNIVPNYPGDLGAVPNAGGDPSVIPWVIDVVVRGNNQGLAQFLGSAGVYKAGDMVKGHEVAKPSLQPGGWVPDSYKTPPGTTVADFSRVVDAAIGGGPGLDSGLGGTGTPSPTSAWIEQFGNGYPLKWIARQYGTYSGGGTRKKWQGERTWGIGMDSRKSVLLQNEGGPYVLFNGTLDVTGWELGQYVVKVWPNSGGNSVLRSTFDLNLNWEQNIVEFTTPENTTGGDFFFTVVPEPATLLLLAGAAALIRRRRA